MDVEEYRKNKKPQPSPWIILVSLIIAIGLTSWIVKELWNYVVPSVFGLSKISLYQSIALLILIKLLM